MPLQEQNKLLQVQNTGRGALEIWFWGCGNISFSVSTIAKTYNLMYDVGRAI